MQKERARNMFTTGERLLKMREELGLNQDEAAAKIGTTRPTLSKWENGQAMSAEYIQPCCELFGCDPAYLLGMQDKKTKAETDITAVTGLDEEAIQTLGAIKDKLGFSSVEVLKFVSYVINNADYKKIMKYLEVNAAANLRKDPEYIELAEKYDNGEKTKDLFEITTNPYIWAYGLSKRTEDIDVADFYLTRNLNNILQEYREKVSAEYYKEVIKEFNTKHGVEEVCENEK